METIYKEKPDRSGRALAVVLTLFAVVCCAIIYFLAVRMPQFIARNPQKLELRYRNTKRFTPEEKKRFIESHAGLWVYSLEVNAGGMPLKRSDLLEIRSNGIVWEVIEWDVSMPGRSAPLPARLIQIRTVYVTPYGVLKNDTLNDAYTIHQTFIRTGDTCFGGWNFPETWHIAKSGDSLVLNRKKYAPYKGEFASFFPTGLVDLVGTGGTSENPYFKRNGRNPMGSEIELTASVKGIRDSGTGIASRNPMTMPDCLDMTNLCDVFKAGLFQACKAGTMTANDPAGIDSLLERYYQPLLIDEHFALYPWPLPRDVTVSFSLRRDGSLDNIRVDRSHEIDRMLVSELIHEIGTWRLPSVSTPLEIIAYLHHAVTLPSGCHST